MYVSSNRHHVVWTIILRYSYSWHLYASLFLPRMDTKNYMAIMKFSQYQLEQQGDLSFSIFSWYNIEF